MRLQSVRTFQRILTPLAAICLYQAIVHIPNAHAAIVPPPWSDPVKNPCARLPNGWQLLYWAPLNDCFKIFQVSSCHFTFFQTKLILIYSTKDGVPLSGHDGAESDRSKPNPCQWVHGRVSMSPWHRPKHSHIEMP